MYHLLACVAAVGQFMDHRCHAGCGFAGHRSSSGHQHSLDRGCHHLGSLLWRQDVATERHHHPGLVGHRCRHLCAHPLHDAHHCAGPAHCIAGLYHCRPGFRQRWGATYRAVYQRSVIYVQHLVVDVACAASDRCSDLAQSAVAHRAVCFVVAGRHHRTHPSAAHPDADSRRPVVGHCCRSHKGSDHHLLQRDCS